MCARGSEPWLCPDLGPPDTGDLGSGRLCSAGLGLSFLPGAPSLPCPTCTKFHQGLCADAAVENVGAASELSAAAVIKPLLSTGSL